MYIILLYIIYYILYIIYYILYIIYYILYIIYYILYIILYYIILYYIILYHIILYHIILYYIILYYVILYYIILYYIILYYIMLCYVMLCYRIFDVLNPCDISSRSTIPLHLICQGAMSRAFSALLIAAPFFAFNALVSATLSRLLQSLSGQSDWIWMIYFLRVELSNGHKFPSLMILHQTINHSLFHRSGFGRNRQSHAPFHCRCFPTSAWSARCTQQTQAQINCRSMNDWYVIVICYSCSVATIPNYIRMFPLLLVKNYQTYHIYNLVLCTVRWSRTRALLGMIKSSQNLLQDPFRHPQDVVIICILLYIHVYSIWCQKIQRKVRLGKR